ncbi:MAG: hypothetical protein ACI4FY_04465 [Acetatifactor sp.]
MRYRPWLYIGDSIDPMKVIGIKKKLEENPFFAGVVLIVLSANDYDQLDIIDAKELAQPYYRKSELSVVGIAGDRDEALELVRQMVVECLRDRGDCALKEYLAWEE